MSENFANVSNSSDAIEIRRAIMALAGTVSHTASGEDKPQIAEIFAPEAHAGALDPNVAVVLGSRGAGKSFWAGVLGDRVTRVAAAEAYPKIGLQNVEVKFGYTGLRNDGSVSRATIDARVPLGQELEKAACLWRCVILRSLNSILEPDYPPTTIDQLMVSFADPEALEIELSRKDKLLVESGRIALVIFDALDSLAVEWQRLRLLLDALLEVTWETRGYKAIRIKLFLRPDQLRDMGLRFVELPKLINGATKLVWSGPELYGMFFSRLCAASTQEVQGILSRLFAEEGISLPPTGLGRLRSWPLAYDRNVQSRVFTRMAGPFMGKGLKKGKTYDWPLRHLSDGHNEVTPRSFLTLLIAAAEKSDALFEQALTAEGIRHGLREASKFRVDQLSDEFPWIKRVLLPLARLQVPCPAEQIIDRWNETETLDAIINGARARHFLGPFDINNSDQREIALVQALVRIGVLIVRADGRYDMPDLFRVAARLLKKGAVAPG